MKQICLYIYVRLEIIYAYVKIPWGVRQITEFVHKLDNKFCKSFL